jgi:signal transduction histidine kinase
MQFTLQQLGLLDAPAEEQYDKLTVLASELLNVPVVHISIADHNAKRIFYKSQTGHDAELAEFRELPMELTYCQHVALTEAAVVVDDAAVHPLLVGTPALSDASPAAYLGLPIHSPSGQVLGGLCLMQGTPRTWSKEEISKAEKLAACVSDLVRLKAATLTSERLRREQQEFTYAVSHDLRAPANTLQMVLEEVSLEGDCLSEDIQGLIRQGIGTVQRMGEQVEDVLNYSRTVDLDEEQEDVALTPLIEDILSDLHASIKSADATINCGPLPTINGHRLQLRALFQNLIANALKFRTPARKPLINISAKIGARDGAHIITVADNGIGIDEKDREAIFSLFKRLHLRESYEGTGVGLSLCRRVAENHNGTIAVTSDGQTGTSFSVTLPVNRA